MLEYNRQWRARNPGRRLALERARNLQKKYGVSLETYQQMVLAQGGRCAICQEPSAPLCVDHNHATKKVRALLCKSCNLMLGNAKEDQARLARAIEYLQTYEPAIS